MDTNVVSEYLSIPNNYTAFKLAKRHTLHQFISSSTLLTEVFVTPNMSKVRSSFRIIHELCSEHLVLKELDLLFKEEISYAISDIKQNLFLSRKAAQEFLSQFDAPNNISTRLWLQEYKKTSLKLERKDIREAGKCPISDPINFETLIRAGMASSFIRTRINGLHRAFFNKDLSDNELTRIVQKIQSLPILKTFALYLLAHHAYYEIPGKTPQKHGNDVDFRHLLCAANADIFLTTDPTLRKIIDTAGTRWPFTTMHPKDLPLS
jgi:hypothetical protein